MYSGRCFQKNEKIIAKGIGIALYGSWSLGRSGAGTAYHAISFAGFMVFLPLIATVAGLAFEVLAGHLHPQLSPSRRNDNCAKSRCLRHHGGDGVALRFLLYSRRLSSQSNCSHCRRHRCYGCNLCSAKCKKRRLNVKII